MDRFENHIANRYAWLININNIYRHVKIPEYKSDIIKNVLQIQTELEAFLMVVCFQKIEWSIFLAYNAYFASGLRNASNYVWDKEGIFLKTGENYQRKVWITHISFEDRLFGMHKVFWCHKHT